MNEKVIKSLLRVFSVIAKEDGLTESEVYVVERFLDQQISRDLIPKYIELFKSYAREGEKESWNVEELCLEINNELVLKQKYIVITRLTELVAIDGYVSFKEEYMVLQAARVFNIPENEFHAIKNFVVQTKNSDFASPNELIVTNQALNEDQPYVKYIFNPSVDGSIFILRLVSANLYFLKVRTNNVCTVNGYVLQNNQVYMFNSGSAIHISNSDSIFYHHVVSEFIHKKREYNVVFEAKGLEYYFKKGKKALNNINLKESSGTLVGIMGASGAGKSTLFSTLNGDRRPKAGTVKINGIDLYDENEKLKGLIGFVPQEDLLFEDLTVFQNLYYSAKLSYPNLSNKEVIMRVQKVLSDLVMEDIASLKVGNALNKQISGGQRKRLNIALELVRDPAILFVDEPTSGLSSRDSENIMDLLKELTLAGRLVFVVIHQPSSDIFKMFDHMYILDYGGYPVYYGNPLEAVTYFKRSINHVHAEQSECPECGNVNPEQIFDIIEQKTLDEFGRPTNTRRVTPEQWNVKYEELGYYKTIQEQKYDEAELLLPRAKKTPNLLYQLWIFIKRDILTKIANIPYLVITFTEAPFLAVLLAFLFKYYEFDEQGNATYSFSKNENIPIYIFVSVIVALFIGMTLSAEEILKDRRIMKREKFLHLSRFSYLMSKVLILFVISAIQMLSFVLVGNYILEIKGMTTSYWLVLFATATSANLIGLNISNTFKSAVTVYIIIPILLIPQLVLAGAMIPFNKLNPKIAATRTIPLIAEFINSRWAYEALTVKQFKNNDYEQIFYEFDKKMAIASFKKDYLIPTLQTKVSFLKNHLTEKNDSIAQLKEKAIILLKNELQKEASIHPKHKFEGIDKISTQNFNEKTASDLKAYLYALSNTYKKKFKQSLNEKDKLAYDLQKTDKDKEAFINLKSHFQNERLKEIVENRNDEVRILEIDNRLVQKIDPIYLEAVPSNYVGFRAPFYSPQKYFFGRFYDTFYFNITSLWVITIVLFILLYFEIFKKLFNL